MKKHLITLLTSGILLGEVGAQAAVVTLANYTFTHASGSLPAGWNSDVAETANMTASNVGITGASFNNSTANMLRFTDTATTAFSSETNFLHFTLTADTNYYFDMTDPLSAVSFQIDRVSGDSPQQAQMQVFAGTDATGTLLFTSSLGSSTGSLVTVTDTGAIAAINSTNQYDSLYVQVQWRGDSTPASSTYTFDNFKIDGNITAVPEPSTYALFAGFLALGGVMLRRRFKD